MKQTIKFIFVLVLIGIIGVLFFQYKKQNSVGEKTSETSTSSATATIKKIYTSKKYTFSFSYPSDYETQEIIPEHIIVRKKDDAGFYSIANITLIESSPNSESTFEEFALDEARLGCAADGPGESWSCSEVKNLKPFSTISNLEGEKFYLMLQIKRMSADAVTKKIGPYIIFNSTDLTKNMSALIISSNLERDVTESDTQLIESIARSMKF